MIFQKKKSLFQATKRRSSKSQKINIFPKGLTHGFCRKMAIFPIFFYQAIQGWKTFIMIFQNKKKTFQAMKTRSSKSRKIDIFPKGVNPCFFSKNGHFLNFVFQAIWATKLSFIIFQRQKTPFQAIKTTSLKKQKN